MYALQSSWLMPLRYRHGFHSRLANLNRLLRYFLGIVVTAVPKYFRCDHFCHTLHVTMKIGLYLNPKLGLLTHSLYGCMEYASLGIVSCEMFPDIVSFSCNDYSLQSPYLFVSRWIKPLEAPLFQETNSHSFPEGERPTQTTHQILFLPVFAVQVRKYTSAEWYFTDDST